MAPIFPRVFALCACLVVLAACEPADEPVKVGGPLLPSNPASSFEGEGLELARAVDAVDRKRIRALIQERKVDPDHVFATTDKTPLIAWPVLTRNIAGLRALLENGADPNARAPAYANGKRPNNALVYAARERNPIYLQLLLDAGGDPNTRSASNEPLTYVAFLRGQWQNVKVLIERGARPNDVVFAAPGERGHDTVLNWYSQRGAMDKVYWLLQHGADPTVEMASPKRPAQDGPHPRRQPILEDIFWLPVQPHMQPWQTRCQQWVLARGIERPPLPRYLRERRIQLGLPVDEQAVPLPKFTPLQDGPQSRARPEPAAQAMP